ncbi:hypothetical protein HX900_35060 [Rhizobium sp. WYCCWR 11290]|uniref:DUF4062 domain-containing protein n=1 Tax=Rhizobium changzhiense TaxID=2692317 RepID=A0A7Z0ZWH2_9HYPH|nr:hypothetical protein [Rhizobium changzhiense]NZD66266.1 hypothetical protein [Rhizobium changzhiense]
MAQRIITIFLSTPSDVAEERGALSSLISEINDVVAFLAPERNVSLKLIHYETNVYPNIGSAPQDVINTQIPIDYDIHFGVMWRRCGTPTKSADSGTVEEFDRALAHREKTGKPTIMFYFSNEEITLPTSDDEIEQLRKVMTFRRRLETIGLTAAYPTRAEFRERARIGLLRAVADILRNDLPRRDQSDELTAGPALDETLAALAKQYDKIREDMQPGSSRTRRMTAILEDMKAEAPTAQGSLADLMSHGSPGHRLAAIAVLQVFPSRQQLPWLADRLDPELEKPFIGYQAAMALLQAVRSLPSSDCEMLKSEVSRAHELASRNPHDPPRIAALEYALRELKVKCG